MLANFGVDNLRFLTPVKFGDALTVTLTCKQMTPRDTPTTARCAGTPTSPARTASRWPRYDVLTLVAKQWPPA